MDFDKFGFSMEFLQNHSEENNEAFNELKEKLYTSVSAFIKSEQCKAIEANDDEKMLALLVAIKSSKIKAKVEKVEEVEEEKVEEVEEEKVEEVEEEKVEEVEEEKVEEVEGEKNEIKKKDINKKQKKR